MIIKYLRANEETIAYWEKRYSAKTLEKKRGRFVESKESRNNRCFGKQPPIRIKSIMYLDVQDVEEKVEQIEELLAEISHLYYVNNKDKFYN